MAGAHEGLRIVRFGDVEANLDTGEIVRPGRRLILPDQPLRILVRLIDRPHGVVSRDELRRELWAEDTFVDFEHGLNSAIKRLRDALGDSADAPRYIETVPRRGYRFLGHLETAGTSPETPAATHPQTPGSSPLGNAVSRTSRWIPIALVLVFAVSALAWRTWPGGRRSSSVGLPIADNRILIVAVESDSGARSLSAVGKLAADHLIAVISRVDSADVLPTAVPSASAEDTVASGLRSGAALAVEVVPRALASDLFFEARVHNTRTREVLYFSPRFQGTVQQPTTVLEQLAQVVAGAIAVHLDHVFGGLQVTSEPPLLDAYLEYRAGRELMDKDSPRAIAHLQRASRISPGYLIPRLTLVMAYDNQGDRRSVSQQMAQIADNAHRLSAAERLLVEYMSESLAQRSESALLILLETEKLVPNSWMVNYSIQQEALAAHRPSVAIAAFDRLPLHDRDRRYNAWRLGALTRALHLVGDYNREVAESRRAQDYEPGSPFYQADEVRARAALGDVAGVAKVIDDALATRLIVAGPTLVIERGARELRAHGHKQASIEVANRGVEWLRARPPTGTADVAQRGALARLLYLAERWPESEKLFERLAAEQPESLEYVGYLGAIAARRLDRSRASGFAERLQRWDNGDVYGRHTYWRAAIASVLGERERAVALLRDAFAQGHRRGLRIHESPELESLRDFAPFAALVSPRH